MEVGGRGLRGRKLGRARRAGLPNLQNTSSPATVCSSKSRLCQCKCQDREQSLQGHANTHAAPSGRSYGRSHTTISLTRVQLALHVLGPAGKLATGWTLEGCNSVQSKQSNQRVQTACGNPMPVSWQSITVRAPLEMPAGGSPRQPEAGHLFTNI